MAFTAPPEAADPVTAAGPEPQKTGGFVAPPAQADQALTPESLASAPDFDPLAAAKQRRSILERETTAALEQLPPEDTAGRDTALKGFETGLAADPVYKLFNNAHTLRVKKLAANPEYNPREHYAAAGDFPTRDVVDEMGKQGLDAGALQAAQRDTAFDVAKYRARNFGGFDAHQVKPDWGRFGHGLKESAKEGFGVAGALRGTGYMLGDAGEMAQGAIGDQSAEAKANLAAREVQSGALQGAMHVINLGHGIKNWWNDEHWWKPGKGEFATMDDAALKARFEDEVKRKVDVPKALAPENLDVIGGDTTYKQDVAAAGGQPKANLDWLRIGQPLDAKGNPVEMSDADKRAADIATRLEFSGYGALAKIPGYAHVVKALSGGALKAGGAAAESVSKIASKLIDSKLGKAATVIGAGGIALKKGLDVGVSAYVGARVAGAAARMAQGAAAKVKGLGDEILAGKPLTQGGRIGATVAEGVKGATQGAVGAIPFALGAETPEDGLSTALGMGLLGGAHPALGEAVTGKAWNAGAASELATIGARNASPEHTAAVAALKPYERDAINAVKGLLSRFKDPQGNPIDLTALNAADYKEALRRTNPDWTDTELEDAAQSRGYFYNGSQAYVNTGHTGDKSQPAYHEGGHGVQAALLAMDAQVRDSAKAAASEALYKDGQPVPEFSAFIDTYNKSVPEVGKIDLKKPEDLVRAEDEFIAEHFRNLANKGGIGALATGDTLYGRLGAAFNGWAKRNGLKAPDTMAELGWQEVPAFTAKFDKVLQTAFKGANKAGTPEPAASHTAQKNAARMAEIEALPPAARTAAVLGEYDKLRRENEAIARTTAAIEGTAEEAEAPAAPAKAEKTPLKPAIAPNKARADAELALVALGWPKNTAKTAAQAAAGVTTEEIVKNALAGRTTPPAPPVVGPSAPVKVPVPAIATPVTAKKPAIAAPEAVATETAPAIKAEPEPNIVSYEGKKPALRPVNLDDLAPGAGHEQPAVPARPAEPALGAKPNSKTEELKSIAKRAFPNHEIAPGDIAGILERNQRMGIETGIPESELPAVIKRARELSPKPAIPAPKAGVKQGDKITRFTHKDGKGLLDRSAWDLSKLTDSEELELPRLLEFGMQQPKDVPGGDKFYFTEEGLKQHKKLLKLIAKASKSGGLVKEETTLEGDPSWESSDGQIAIGRKTKTPNTDTNTPEETAAVEAKVAAKGGERKQAILDVLTDAATGRPELLQKRTDARGKVSYKGRLDFSLPEHRAFVRELGLEPEAAAKLKQAGEATGGAKYVDYWSAANLDPGDITGKQRKAEYAADKAKKSRTELQKNKAIIFTGLTAWPSGSVVQKGISVDKFVANTAKLLGGAKEHGLGVDYNGVNDPAILVDLEGYVENHKNNWRGDGSAPVTGKAPTPGYEPHLIERNRFDLLNAAFNIDTATAKSKYEAKLAAREATKAAGGKSRKPAIRAETLENAADAQALAKENDWALDDATGDPNPFRALLNKEGKLTHTNAKTGEVRKGTAEVLEPVFEALAPDMIAAIRDIPNGPQETVRGVGFTGDTGGVLSKGLPKFDRVAAGFMPGSGGKMSPKEIEDYIIKNHPISDALKGYKAWLTKDGRWINVDDHYEVAPSTDNWVAQGGDIKDAGFARIEVDPQENKLYLDGTPTPKQLKEAKDTAIENGWEFERDNGRSFMPDTPKGDIDAEPGAKDYIETTTAIRFAKQTLGADEFKRLTEGREGGGKDIDATIRAYTAEQVAREVVKAAQDGKDATKEIEAKSAKIDAASEARQARRDKAYDPKFMPAATEAGKKLEQAGMALKQEGGHGVYQLKLYAGDKEAGRIEIRNYAGDKEAEILSIEVDPEFRSGGLGEALMREAGAWAKARGVKDMLGESVIAKNSLRLWRKVFGEPKALFNDKRIFKNSDEALASLPEKYPALRDYRGGTAVTALNRITKDQRFMPHDPKAKAVESDIRTSGKDIVKAAQEEYDAWDQTKEEGDPDMGFGGICDRISDAISSVLSEKGFDVTEGGQEGDDHAFVYATKNGKVFAVDIPPGVYETGGGYNWKKKEGVKFDENHIDIYEVNYEDVHGEPYNPEGEEEGRYMPAVKSTSYDTIPTRTPALRPATATEEKRRKPTLAK